MDLIGITSKQSNDIDRYGIEQNLFDRNQKRTTTTTKRLAQRFDQQTKNTSNHQEKTISTRTRRELHSE